MPQHDDQEDNDHDADEDDMKDDDGYDHDGDDDDTSGGCGLEERKKVDLGADCKASQAGRHRAGGLDKLKPNKLQLIPDLNLCHQ